MATFSYIQIKNTGETKFAMYISNELIFLM